VLRFRLHLESLGLAAGTVNQRLAAVRRLAYEAADSGLLSPELEAGIRRVSGRLFRAVSRHGTPWGTGISENVMWYVMRRVAERMQMDSLAPHDLRRTCAKLCHVNGGELEQIQFLLGHVSVLTTERYLGCKQNLEKPVNDRFGCLFDRQSVG
jgi:integrase